MKAKHPTTHRIETCTLLPEYNQSKDWVRFEDGSLEPLANLDGVSGVELERFKSKAFEASEVRREYEK